MHNSHSGTSSQIRMYNNDNDARVSSTAPQIQRKVQKLNHSAPPPNLGGGAPAEGAAAGPELTLINDPPLQLARPPDDLAVKVMCNGYEGVLYPASSRVLHNDREFTAPQFEQFCGAGSTKKWKISLRVVPGSVPECPLGAPYLSLLVSRCVYSRSSCFYLRQDINTS